MGNQLPVNARLVQLIIIGGAPPMIKVSLYVAGKFGPSNFGFPVSGLFCLFCFFFFSFLFFAIFMHLLFVLLPFL
ncbi:hypothetical protein F2Y18_08460 [Bacillus cereus]|uniref:Uncharacterized protein n=2 Tax=Bacillus cereus group TaxID=86661 RepID=A0A4Y8T7E3_BACTU|nr:hypothetical protein F2Y18_08460 [Bacillus cereus]TFF46942.1 hypothetical protein EQ803_08115 [Bacillus thuringiensis]